MKEPIGILQIANQFAIGGAEGQFVARVRALPRSFRQVVACLHRVGPHLEPLRKLGYEPEEFGLRGKLAQLNTGAQVLRLAALIEREDVKLVHSNDFYASMLAVPAARLAGAKVVCSRFDLGHWSSRAQRFSEALLCRAADAVLVNAGAVRDLVAGEDGVEPEKIEVVHNGIDLQAFDAARRAEPLEPIPAGRPTVAVIANLYPVKGHLDILDAVELLKPQIPELLVLFAGEGPMRPVLEAQIAQRGLRETVLLLGHRLDVPALLARANVGLLASHAEGLSNALIEAMAASLPVVSTSVGGNGELVRAENGVLVAPRQPGALAEALGTLLRDKGLAEKLGAAGRKRVETELTLEAMGAKTASLYWKLLSAEPQKQVA